MGWHLWSARFSAQCLAPHGYPTEDTLELSKTLLLSSHFLAQKHSIASYWQELSLELVSCGPLWLIDVFRLVHIEIFKNLHWLSMYKNWEHSHWNLDFWLIWKSWEFRYHWACTSACGLAPAKPQPPVQKGRVRFSLPLFHPPLFVVVEGKFTGPKINHF